MWVPLQADAVQAHMKRVFEPMIHACVHLGSIPSARALVKNGEHLGFITWDLYEVHCTLRTYTVPRRLPTHAVCARTASRCVPCRGGDGLVRMQAAHG